MITVRLTGPRSLLLAEEPIPDIRPDEALLKIEAVGVCGSDLHRYRGITFEDASNFQLILGHEFSATVAKVGAQVRNVQVGDRVAVEAGINCGECEWCLRGHPNLCPQVQFCGTPPVHGALREYMPWPTRLLYKLPDALTFDDGVMVEVAGIAMHAIDLANMRPGQSAAVLGCGPIGLATVHLLRQAVGTTLIVATDILPYRLDYAADKGADLCLNPRKTDVVDQVMRITNGRGVDVVFEAAGVQQTCEQAVQICAPGGKVIFIGIPEDDRTPFATTPARRKGLTFRFCRRSKHTYERTIEMIERAVIDLSDLVTHHFPISRAKDAYDLVEQYQDGVIKAIINP